MEYVGFLATDKKAAEELVKEEFRKLRLAVTTAVLYAGPCRSLNDAVNAAFEVELLVKREL